MEFMWPSNFNKTTTTKVTRDDHLQTTAAWSLENQKDTVMYPYEATDAWSLGHRTESSYEATSFWDSPHPVSHLFGFWKQEGEYVRLAVVLVVVMVVSLLGNTMVIVVTAPKLWTGVAIPPNVLVLSLAVSDVLRVFFDMLPKAVEYFCMQWVLGREICKVVSALRCVFADFSMSTMALISFERYRAVDKPTGTVFSVRGLSLALLLLCLWTVASAAPLGFWFDTVHFSPQGYGAGATVLCTVPFPSSKTTALYTSITRVTNFFAPLTVSWLCYMGVVRKTIKSRTRVSHGITGAQKSRRQRVSQKVTITCFCLVMMFTLTLTPFQLSLLVLQYGSADNRQQAARCLKYLWLLTLVESTSNPFLYGLMWENFRKSVKRILQPSTRKSNTVVPLVPHNNWNATKCNRSPKLVAVKTVKTDPTVLTLSTSSSVTQSKTLGPCAALCKNRVHHVQCSSGLKVSAVCRNMHTVESVTTHIEADSSSLP